MKADKKKEDRRVVRIMLALVAIMVSTIVLKAAQPDGTALWIIGGVLIFFGVLIKIA